MKKNKHVNTERKIKERVVTDTERAELQARAATLNRRMEDIATNEELLSNMARSNAMAALAKATPEEKKRTIEKINLMMKQAQEKAEATLNPVAWKRQVKEWRKENSPERWDSFVAKLKGLFTKRKP